jgi:predicted NAD/FAD-dependent oxidoreductase
MKIAIIGAGLSGSHIYSKLKKDGHDLTLFEKARGAGGRCSTRYINDNKVNHGTYDFESSSQDFQDFCDLKVKESILVKKVDKYCSNKEGINKLCSSLIDINDLVKNTKITSCRFIHNNWTLVDQNGIKYENFDRLIFSIPATQILEVDLEISNTIKQKLKNVKYDSVATIISYSHSIEQITSKKLFSSKIINNSIQSDGKNFSCYIFHLDKNLTNKQSFQNKEMVKEYMLEKIYQESGLKLEDNFYVVPHFWKYAFVSKGLAQDYIYDENLGLGICGDYFNGNNLESAYLSSKRLYENKF